MQAVIVVRDASSWRRDGTPGGLALLERQLRQLRVLGCTRATLLVATPEPPPLLRAEAVTLTVHHVAADDGEPLAIAARDGDAFAIVAAAVRLLPERFVLLSADYLVDLRVLRAAAQGCGDTLIVDGGGETVPIGRVSRASVERHGRALAGGLPPLAIAALDPYAPELRGRVPPYVQPVRTPTERRAAWRVLLDGVQKRGLDLPGEYFDSPFENALVRALAPTRVTPNQVTAVTLALAALVGLLFLRGALGSGLTLALVVGVLDGVDGKLARLKLATSRLGELEHVGDFLYENFWWVALALHLHAATGGAVFAGVGLTVVACDLIDNLLYGAVRLRTGRLLDELAPLDRAFRRVAGRRNVYVWMLIAGSALRGAGVAFVAVAAWALVTVLVHGVRAVHWTARGGGLAAETTRRDVPSGDAEPAQLSVIEPVAGAFVTDK